MAAERRIVVISGDSGPLAQPLGVVLEMLGPTITLLPGESLRLLVSGPKDAELEIGCGPNGVSVYRDPRLHVEVIGPDGDHIDTEGFA